MNYIRSFLLFLCLILCGQSLSAQLGASDCVDFVVVCGNSQLLLNTSGVGIDDFASAANQRPDCGFSETQSLWLKIPIAQDGQLEFTISSNNGQDDFDFAIYGPNRTCTNLGPSIRCSSTNPQAAQTPAETGLRIGENETSDGPGSSGNGFVDPLDVKAGEEYIILIDNFDQTNAGFELTWGGSADIIAPPVANDPGGQEFCDPDSDGELIVDLSYLNDEIINGQLGVGVKYYLSENDALLDLNSLNTRQVLIENGSQQLYALVTAGESGCNDIVSFNVKVNSTPMVDEVTGPMSVCPTVEGVPYASSGVDVDLYEWIIAGGTIASGQGTPNITVDWGAPNDNAILKMVGKNLNGCVSDTVFYPVRVNTRLEPETPKGPDAICFDDRLSTLYSVTQIPGSVYEWTIENGTIVGAADENEVEIRWNENATSGRISLKEFNPSIAECEGFSDTVTVQLLDEIVVTAEVTESLCAFENTGMIKLTVGGGAVVAVNVAWSDISTLTDTRENLEPGTYEYTATDNLGCVITGTVQVTEPPLFALDNLMPVSTNCYESSDGGFTTTVSGVSGPYTYRIFDSTDGTVTLDSPIQSGSTAGDVLEVGGLSQGFYGVLVVNENGCQSFTTFTVPAPPLLEADLQSLILQPTCPGQANGAISIDAVGGTPDYQFFWSPGAATEGPLIEELASGIYTVRIVDANGCEATLTTTVEEVQPRVQVPDAFSPNGDGENEIFAPVSNCPLGDYQFTIFNRWGSRVFSTTDQSQGWDGQFQGEPAPDGRYSYRLSYRIRVNGDLIEENFQGVMRIFR